MIVTLEIMIIFLLLFISNKCLCVSHKPCFCLPATGNRCKNSFIGIFYLKKAIKQPTMTVKHLVPGPFQKRTQCA